MTLTIYSDDFDENDSISDGFCGDVFVEDHSGGKRFRKNLSGAMKWIVENNIKINEIVFNYRDENTQMFKKFQLT